MESRSVWDEQQKEVVARAIEEHQQAIKHKARMQRMFEDKEKFVSKLKSARRSDFQVSGSSMTN